MRKGWEVKKFDDVISSSLIGLVRNNKQQSPEFAYRYLKMSNIKNDNGLNEDSFVFVDATDEEVEKYSLKQNDFLFNTRNSYELVGKTCLYKTNYNEPTLFNNNILRVTFKKELLPQFAAYAFCSYSILDELEKMKSGTTSVVGIYYKSLKNLQIPIPPLPEQKQIVAILDKAFAAIDQAKANIKKNIENAKELFQSKLNDIFSQQGDGWEEKTLGEVCDLKNGYAFKSKEFKEGGIRLLRNCNVFHGEVDWSKTAYYEDSALNEYQRFELFEGDIVLSLDRPIISTGLKLARIRSVDVPSLLLQRVLCIRATNDNNDYIFSWMSSPFFLKEINPGKSLGVPHISLSEVGAITLPIPPIEKQEEILNLIDVLNCNKVKIISVYENKLSSLEELKKTILQKAFAGELV
jgi:type I restriction enzyme, S subunit